MSALPIEVAHVTTCDGTRGFIPSCPACGGRVAYEGTVEDGTLPGDEVHYGHCSECSSGISWTVRTGMLNRETLMPSRVEWISADGEWAIMAEDEPFHEESMRGAVAGLTVVSPDFWDRCYIFSDGFISYSYMAEFEDAENYRASEYVEIKPDDLLNEVDRRLRLYYSIIKGKPAPIIMEGLE